MQPSLARMCPRRLGRMRCSRHEGLARACGARGVQSLARRGHHGRLARRTDLDGRALPDGLEHHERRQRADHARRRRRARPAAAAIHGRTGAGAVAGRGERLHLRHQPVSREQLLLELPDDPVRAHALGRRLVQRLELDEQRRQRRARQRLHEHEPVHAVRVRQRAERSELPRQPARHERGRRDGRRQRLGAIGADARHGVARHGLGAELPRGERRRHDGDVRAERGFRIEHARESGGVRHAHGAVLDRADVLRARQRAELLAGHASRGVRHRGPFVRRARQSRLGVRDRDQGRGAERDGSSAR